MSITLVNTTGFDAPSFGNTFTITIPATSVGNTLIVLVSNVDAGNHSLGTTSVQDDEANPAAWTRISGATNAMSRFGTSYEVDIYYRADIPAGLTFVTIGMGSALSGPQVYVVEADGVNRATPFEIANTTHIVTSSVNPHEGIPITTAYTNALFVSAAMKTSSGAFNGIGNGWTGLIRPHGGLYQEYKIDSGTQTPAYNGGATIEMVCSTAVFNPTPNSFTLGLNETVNTADSRVSEPETVYTEEVFLDDLIDNILSTNTHFKTLLDAFSQTDSVSFVWNAAPTLVEALPFIDSVTFIQNKFRTYSEEVRIQDWLSVKIIDSRHWGN